MSKNLPVEQKANLWLRKITLILAKIAELLHWLMTGVMIIIALCSLIWSAPVLEWVSVHILGSENVLSCYGFEMAITSTGTLAGFAIGSAIVLSLMAMVFRNIYLILKTAAGKTWFTAGDTPFQHDVVRMLREIGIFLIIISIISLVSTAIVSCLGGEVVSGFNYLSGFMGLVFVCISQFFNYGLGLEEDLDGLV